MIVTSANPLPQRDSKASFESLQVQTKPRVFQNRHHRAHSSFSSSPCLVYFSTFLSLQESAFPLWELYTSDHFQSQLCQPPAFFISLCLSASPSSLLGLPKHILRAQHDRAALHHVGHSSSTPSHHTHCSLSRWLPGGSLVTVQCCGCPTKSNNVGVTILLAAFNTWMRYLRMRLWGRYSPGIPVERLLVKSAQKRVLRVPHQPHSSPSLIPSTLRPRHGVCLCHLSARESSKSPSQC